MFRALKTKGNTPKYGLIYHSTFIGRASAKNKGRISRYLANKCSIAARIDSFIDEPTNAFGEQLRDQVEERLKFYDTGETPRKNIDVMTAVAEKLRKSEKKSKKSKNKDTQVVEEVEQEAQDVDVEDANKEKKKKKKKVKRNREESSNEVEEESDSKKKQKKNKNLVS